MKKTVIYHIDSDSEILLKRFCGVDNTEIVFKKSLGEILDLDSSIRYSFYIGVDDRTDQKDFRKLLYRFSKSSINIVFYTKRYELLLIAYRSNVNYVFENRINEAEMISSVDRSKIENDLEVNKLPQVEILKLFSIPIKIKSSNQLYTRLKSYFRKFNSIDKVSIVEIKQDEHRIIGDNVNELNKDLISSLKIPNHYIGFEHKVSDNESEVVITPTFISEETQVWLAVKLDKSNSNYILNELFYKYLENILIYRKNKEKESNLIQLAATDEITGLYNQRQLSKDLEIAVDKHQKLHESFSIMFIDVDHFKKVNDNYGHIVGSHLLSELGNALKLILRQSDHIYRYGGDEFVIIMPNVDNKTVHEVALRVLNKVKNTPFKIDNERTYDMSLSIGIAEYPTDAKSALEIIKFADEMMYKSKKSGRGKVFHVSEVSDANTGS